jgi:hypothetical protein
MLNVNSFKVVLSTHNLVRYYNTLHPYSLYAVHINIGLAFRLSLKTPL